MKLTKDARIVSRQTLASAAVLVSCVAASATAGAATPCPPVAIVVGEAAIVAPVAAILRRRGLRAEPSGCGRVVNASLTSKPDLRTFALHIEDGYGRVSDREIADAGTAASLIESWTLDEDADVLTPRAPATRVDATLVAPPPRLAVSASEAFRAMTLGELSTASDGSLWYGAGVTACGRIGPTCIGGRARIARDGGGGTGELTGYVSRTRIDARAIAAWPLARGGFTFTPLVGLGVDWNRSVVDQVPLQLATDLGTNDVSLAAEAAVGAARAVTQHLSVVVEVGGVYGHPVSSRGRDGPESFMPLPPNGLLRLGLGLQYAR